MIPLSPQSLNFEDTSKDVANYFKKLLYVPYFLQNSYASKVKQLDGQILNNLISRLLKTSLISFLHVLSNYEERFKHIELFYDKELTFSINFLLFWVCVRHNKSLPGDFLLGLRYKNNNRVRDFNDWKKYRADLASSIENDGLTRKQRLYYLLFNVVLPYVIGNSRSNYQITNLTTYLSYIFNILRLLNFVLFLYHGKYRTILDRFLRISLVAADFQKTKPLAVSLVVNHILFDRVNSSLISFLRLLTIFAAFDFKIVTNFFSLISKISKICYNNCVFLGDIKRYKIKVGPYSLFSWATDGTLRNKTTTILSNMSCTYCETIVEDISSPIKLKDGSVSCFYCNIKNKTKY